jgi:hypothetical protein
MAPAVQRSFAGFLQFEQDIVVIVVLLHRDNFVLDRATRLIPGASAHPYSGLEGPRDRGPSILTSAPDTRVPLHVTIGCVERYTGRKGGTSHERCFLTAQSGHKGLQLLL